MTQQIRLPFPRGARVPITCSHTDRRHYAKGMCHACYSRRYRLDNLDAVRYTERKRWSLHRSPTARGLRYKTDEEDSDWSLSEWTGHD